MILTDVSLKNLSGKIVNKYCVSMIKFPVYKVVYTIKTHDLHMHVRTTQKAKRNFDMQKIKTPFFNETKIKLINDFGYLFYESTKSIN